MKLKINMGKDYDSFVKAWDKFPGSMADAIEDGLEVGCTNAANAVSMAIQSGSHNIKSRSGMLAKSIAARKDPTDRLSMYIGSGDNPMMSNPYVSKYSWLLTDEVKTIEPKGHPYLAIPLNKTGAGVSREYSPRDYQGSPIHRFFKSKSGGLFFGREEADGSMTPLFVLKRSVVVIGSGVLYDVVDAAEPKIKNTIRNYIKREIKKLGFKSG